MKLPDYIENKIGSIQQLVDILEVEKTNNKKIVFTNGCFDILHPGHIQILSEAKKQGDILVVGLNTDASVKRLKGKDRPINHEKARAILLAAIAFVDYIVLFDEDTPSSLIKTLLPDVLVKGGDYKADEIVGADTVRENGGEVVIVPTLKGYSTSGIIQNLSSQK